MLFPSIAKAFMPGLVIGASNEVRIVWTNQIAAGFFTNPGFLI
jgi:hypothetical protein